LRTRLATDRTRTRPCYLPFEIRRPGDANVLSSFVVLSLCSLLHPVAFTARAADCRGLPQNLQVERDLRPAVTVLLARSRTLRAQCQRIAASPATRVTVVLAMSPMDAATRARSIARRYESGLLVVEVQLPPASRDFAELLAHELEHVTELIEGVDFPQRATTRGGGVFASGPHGSFESDRARNAGLAAAAEVGSGTDEPAAAAARAVSRAWRAVARFARAPFRR
jgi:hypothetical protein